MLNPQAGSEELYQMLAESGTLMLFSEGSATLVVCILLSRVRKWDLFVEKREAGLQQMVNFFFCSMGLQMISSILVLLMERGLNLLGYSLMEASAVALWGTFSPSMPA